MTIEATLERIAVALETIAAGGGAVATAPAAEKPASKPAASKAKDKPAASKAKKEEPAAEAEAEAEEKEEVPTVTLNAVRAALTSLQKASGADAPKALLKEFKAATLSKLKTDQYQAIIDRAGELVKEAEAE